MSRSSTVFRVGTRPSNLAVVQTRQALDRIRRRLPSLAFEVRRIASPGDRDRATDLRASPPDFFTRDLDDAVREGALDFAIHSAKDLPAPMPPGLDWFWLPWRADERDAWVLRPGARLADLPAEPVIGISSERRAAYARTRFPAARLQPIRGNIEERLRQLDEGRYDVLVMAGAALERLGLPDRVTDWIPASELPPPEGQGALAVTYRMGDARLNRLRWLFVKAVRFVSAGAGDGAHLTLGARRAIEQADVCLHDALMDERTLRFLPRDAKRMNVGKRHGEGGASQDAITRAILDEARKGRRVIRLKGGDAGLFGRLAEEVEALDRLDLPYAILPGVSSLAAATTGTGLLLTRRGVSRGFCALTPRGAGGTVEPFHAAARADLPIVFFMALRLADEIARGLLAEGRAAHTPAAIVLDAGGPSERVIRTTLNELPAAAAGIEEQAAGLLLVGEICRYGTRRRAGPLGGLRVLLTCSDALLGAAATAVTDSGGVPLPLPMPRLVLRAEAVATLRRIAEFDWIVLTSPSAVRCFLEGLTAAGGDLRRVPRLMACGSGTAGALRLAHLMPDLVPTADFGAKGLLQAARAAIKPGDRVLRLRSTRAGDAVGQALAECGAAVTDCILYENEPVRHSHCPMFEAAFFASASAVEFFVEQGFAQRLEGKVVAAIGAPTAEALARAGLKADAMGEPATVAGAIECLGDHFMRKEFES